MDVTQDVAASIVNRHRRRERYESVVNIAGPSLAHAYDIQDRVVREFAASMRHAGYKIGLTTPRMQAMCGVDQPIAGCVFDGRLHTSPAAIEAAPFMHLGLESEIAVQIGAPLPASGLTKSAVLACLSHACAAFELIDDSNADYSRLDAVSLIADNAWNAGLVLGPAMPASEFARFSDRSGTLYRNGEVLDRGTSSDVMGDPLEVVVWLARHLAARGKALKSGQWISTGSIVTTKFVLPGEHYRFEVAGLAPVELAIT